MPASFKTATRSPWRALRVSRPADPRIEVPMLEKDSEVSSISECEVLAWVWIWSVMLRRAEDLAEREARSVEFCL